MTVQEAREIDTLLKALANADVSWEVMVAAGVWLADRAFKVRVLAGASVDEAGYDGARFRRDVEAAQVAERAL